MEKLFWKSNLKQFVNDTGKPKKITGLGNPQRKAREEAENVKMKIIMKEWIMNLYAPDPKDLANYHYHPLQPKKTPHHFIGREWKAKMVWHKNDCVC